MKDDYEKLADLRVEKVMELYKNDNNMMALFVALKGGSFWKLELTPGAGHNYYYIIEAIYRYHKKYPNDKIDDYYTETIKKLALYSFSIEEVSDFFNIVMAELDYKKQNISPFEINMREILDLFQNRLKTDSELYEEKGVISKVSEYDEYINHNHGYKVL